MVPLLPSLQTECAVRRGPGQGMVKRNHHYSYRRIAYQRGKKPVERSADDKTSGNWKAEGANQKSVAILRVRERGIGVAELTLIDFMRKLLCLNAMT